METPRSKSSYRLIGKIEGIVTAVVVGAAALLTGLDSKYQSGREDARTDAFLAVEEEESRITETRLREALTGTEELDENAEQTFAFLNEHKREVASIVEVIPVDERRDAVQLLVASPLVSLLISGHDKVAEELSQSPDDKRLEKLEEITSGNLKIPFGIHSEKAMAIPTPNDREIAI